MEAFTYTVRDSRGAVTTYTGKVKYHAAAAVPFRADGPPAPLAQTAAAPAEQDDGSARLAAQWAGVVGRAT
jgi:hypothetical protein